MTDVEIEQVRIERNGSIVLDVPALRIRANRTTAILGPNGSGKTTLLRVLAGLERTHGGRVRRSASPSGAGVAYVFQEHVFLRRSVLENLELGLRLRGVDAATRRARIAESASLLDVGHLFDRRADRLSGGEARRVSLARALCLRAPLVLLDEPLAGLDGRIHARLLEEMPQLLKAFDATTILVTHDPLEALQLADDFVVLVNGRVTACGDKHQVATNPRSREVAEILGYTSLEADGARIAVPPGGLRLGPGGRELVMVVEEVLDLVNHRELVGRVGDVRVRVTAVAGDPIPRRGDRRAVHAGVFYPLD